MQLLTFKIIPKSSFATVPTGDVIFGQILAYLFLENDTAFANYLDEKPKLIVSDMMPLGYVYRPNLPLECFKPLGEKEVDKKAIRKAKYIKLEELQQGNLSKCEKVDFFQNEIVVKNSINRATFTTDGDNFAPYSLNEFNFTKELWIFIMVKDTIKNKIVATLEQIGKYGFGKEANIGKGVFDIEQINTSIKDIDTNYYMSISPVILQNQSYQNIWYESYTKFGKFGLDKANDNAFKKPTLLAKSATVVKSDKKLNYFGKAVDNGFENKPSFLQGYSIALPIRMKNEI